MLYCIVLYCIVLYCIALYCMLLQVHFQAMGFYCKFVGDDVFSYFSININSKIVL